MSEKKWLICGTRKKGYQEIVWRTLTERLSNERGIRKEFSPLIIEGCCPDSADFYAEEWAKGNMLEIKHFPSTQGNYLKRNVEMVKEADLVFAFWDGYSYGTAHTIATATYHRVPVIVKKLKEVTTPASSQL